MVATLATRLHAASLGANGAPSLLLRVRLA
jgi:hypothetical protein